MKCETLLDECYWIVSIKSWHVTVFIITISGRRRGVCMHDAGQSWRDRPRGYWRTIGIRSLSTRWRYSLQRSLITIDNRWLRAFRALSIGTWILIDNPCLIHLLDSLIQHHQIKLAFVANLPKWWRANLARTPGARRNVPRVTFRHLAFQLPISNPLLFSLPFPIRRIILTKLNSALMLVRKRRNDSRMSTTKRAAKNEKRATQKISLNKT